MIYYKIMIKNALFSWFCINFLAFAFANSVEDARLSFYTRGPDCYADGSIVLDGECYALVWSTDGVFEGFSADGECIDKNDRIILIAPIAKDGRCPLVLFQIPASEADELSSGKYAVYLLDTRIASQNSTRPYGTTNGKLAVINAYGAATANLALKRSSTNNSTTLEDTSITASPSAAPADCAQPRIKALRIDGENAFLTVENLKGFMRVNSGQSVSASDSADAAVETLGDSEDITLVTRKKGNSGFFKVIRSNK
ncbi:MAG: hypothetical protein J6S51_03510 [Kiritimatiellae bacterium]|nr:hypothetical protein [Kiritimatiellia bacterium]